MIYVIFGTVIWVLCGIISCGFMFAYLQNEYPTLAEEYRSDDSKTAYLVSITGPFGLLIAWIMTCNHNYGWVWPHK